MWSFLWVRNLGIVQQGLPPHGLSGCRQAVARTAGWGSWPGDAYSLGSFMWLAKLEPQFPSGFGGLNDLVAGDISQVLHP
jgi:hypothetical protein